MGGLLSLQGVPAENPPNELRNFLQAIRQINARHGITDQNIAYVRTATVFPAYESEEEGDDDEGAKEVDEETDDERSPSPTESTS